MLLLLNLVSASHHYAVEDDVAVAVEPYLLNLIIMLWQMLLP